MAKVNELKRLIVQKDISGIFAFVVNNINFTFERLEFMEMLKSLYTPLNYMDSDVISISGSGKSGVTKPNIGSIVSLFISERYNVKIIKIGSRSKNGKGSTDFFETNKNLIYKRFNNLSNFKYYDIDSISPWKRYHDILCLNKSIKIILEDMIWHEFKYKYKIIGISNKNVFDNYMKYEHYNRPLNIITHTSMCNNIAIDEIVGQTFFNINGSVTNYSFNENIENGFYINNDNIDDINKGFLCGTIKNKFWYDCLKNTFVSYVLLLGLETNIDEATKSFERFF